MTDALLATTNEGTEISVYNEISETGLTFKSGKTVKTVYTPSAVFRAPKAVLLEKADNATVKLITAGRYKPFMQDAFKALNKKRMKSLLRFLAYYKYKGQHLLDIDADENDPDTYIERANKAIFHGVATYLANPVEYVKTENKKFSVVPSPLPKAKQWISDVAKVWLEANPA